MKSMISQGLRTPILRRSRQFHNSSTKFGLLDYFRSKKVDQAPQVPTKNTKDVMRQLENSSESQQLGAGVEAANLEVIGKPVKVNTWSEASNGFILHAFPTKYVAPELLPEEITNALKSAYKTIVVKEDQISTTEVPLTWLETPLNDLQLRFDFSKKVTRLLKIAIPDPVLSSVQTIGDIQAYYIDKVVGVRYNEKEPDAIYLDPAEFEGTNIRIDTSPSPVEIAKKLKSLTKQAKKAVKQKQEEALEAASA